MSTSRIATCSCGQLRVVCEGEPVRISICHCLECQKRTGTVFATQARWPKDRVRIEGSSTKWSRTGDDGNALSFHFCPLCGSTVWYQIDDIPGVVAVATGAFADPHFPAPQFSVYENRRHNWVCVPPDAERY